MASQKAMINTMLFYHWDETLFNAMSLPAGVSRDDVVASILEESSDFPVIITDLETLRFSINKWSAHRVSIWEHLKATTEYTYNPIHNYDRSETESQTVTHTGTGSVKGDGGAETVTSHIANTGTDTTAISESTSDTRSGSDITYEGVSAFNESGYNDHTKTQIDYGAADDTSHSVDQSLSHGLTTDRSDTKTSLHGDVETRNFTDSYHKTVSVSGNIGVMSTQEMIQKERDIADFDIVDIITKEYIKKFCIVIY